MAWEELKPRESVRERAMKAWSAPASIICRDATKDGRQSASIILRDGPDWFVPGARVAAHRGNGPDQGKLLIEPGDSFTVEEPPPTRSKREQPPGKFAQVVLPLYDGANVERRPREPVGIEVGARKITITLPAWPVRKAARPVTVPASPTPSVASAKAATVPYRGLGSRGPDPIVNEDMARRRAGIG